MSRPDVPACAAPVVIKFYTKPDCQLCDEAARLLDAVGQFHPLIVEPVNILTDPILYDAYRERIPVLAFPDGTTLEPPIRREGLAARIRSFGS